MSTQSAGYLKLRLIAFAVAGAAILGGCGDGGDDGATTTSPPAQTSPAPPTTTEPPTTASSPPEPTTATEVTATLVEFSIDLSRRSFTPGRYTFVAEQQGQFPHALSISGPGIEAESTPVIQPGGPSESLAVTLQPGTYQLWCPVGNHRQQGMELTITVQ